MIPPPLAPPALAPLSTTSPPTVLIADDDRSIRTVLTQALGRSGYQVRSTSNAATLWRWVEDGEGDLVITDVVMPDENGLDLIPRIKRVRPDLRVVVMSAQSTLMTAVKAAQRGAFEYLPKPFDLKELLAVVSRALAAPAPQRLSLPEYRQIELYSKRKTLEFDAFAADATPYARLAGIVRAFHLLENARAGGRRGGRTRGGADGGWPRGTARVPGRRLARLSGP